MTGAVVLLLVLMVGSYLLSLLGFLGIGIIIDDHYVFASREAKKHMDKKPYYRQSGIVFACLGTMFLLCLLGAVTGMRILVFVSYGVAFGAMVYAVVSHYRIRKNNITGKRDGEPVPYERGE